MVTKQKCPICSTENDRTYYSEEVGLVEDYYDCNNCGYFSRMCYSPSYEGISIAIDKERKLKVLENYKDKINEMGLKITEEDY